MDVGYPHRAVSPSLDGEVLVTLARSTRPQTGRGIARLVRRGSRPGVTQALGRLTEQGIVSMTEVGSSMVYILNRDHIAAPAVEVLAKLRETLLDRINQELTQWRIQPLHASIFGSAARGDGDTTSDIDLFIIRPTTIDEDDQQWRDQIYRLGNHVRQWTGNNAGIAEISEQQLPQLSTERPLIIEELERDAITLVGKRPERILKR